MDFHGFTRRELQSLCKRNGIPANMTNVAMADALSDLEKVEGIEGVLSSAEYGDSESVNESSQRSDFTSPYVCRSNRARNVTERGSTAAKPMRSSRRTTKKSLTMDTKGLDEKENTSKTTAVRRSARLASKYGKSSREEGTDTLKLDRPAVKYCEIVNLKESLDSVDDAISSVTDVDTLETNCDVIKGETEVVSERRQELSIDKEAAVDTVPEVEIPFEEENGDDCKMKGEGFDDIQIETQNDYERVDDLTKHEEKDVGVESNKEGAEKDSASLEMDLTKQHEEKDAGVESNKEGAEKDSASLEMDHTKPEEKKDVSVSPVLRVSGVEIDEEGAEKNSSAASPEMDLTAVENDPSEKGHELSMDFKEAKDVITEIAGSYIQHEKCSEADVFNNNNTASFSSDEVNVKEADHDERSSIDADEFQDSSNEAPPHSVVLLTSDDDDSVHGVSEEKEEEPSSFCISSSSMPAVQKTNKCGGGGGGGGARWSKHHVKGGNLNLTGSATFDSCLPIPKDLLAPERRKSVFVKTNHHRNDENKENNKNNDDDVLKAMSIGKLKKKLKEQLSTTKSIGPENKKSSSDEAVLLQPTIRSPLQPLEKKNNTRRI
ncbi:hypothetical protein M569_03533 [Genlisea aurea]|uniref:Uncharacterized protein n=1 Tax=Genlisea aurea TaxID=192259 RepID=S8E600_9LAMI|nr:hypothetical protein M569_03533 [Genlisea aurea]